MHGRWIVSARFDLAMIAVPFAVALAALSLVVATGAKEPLWAYLLCFVAFDVAHVWATAYLTYLDGEAFARRRALYSWTPPLAFAAAFALHLGSPVVFWTALSYFAIFHFAKQQYGFIAIYKAKAKERDPLDYRLDKLALWTGALGPVLLWHATPAGQFDWFDGDERFLLRLPVEAQAVIGGVMFLVGAAWVLRQLHVLARGDSLNVGKTLWMTGAWASWYVGVRMADHLLVSAAFLNFFHGLPFLMLVWHRMRARWREVDARPSRPLPLVARLARGRRWVLFYALLFAVAAVEELLWDGVVWRTYLPSATGLSLPELSAVALSLWVALLSLPQVVHYVLDGFLWKLDGKNPDLALALGVGRGPGRSG